MKDNTLMGLKKTTLDLNEGVYTLKSGAVIVIRVFIMMNHLLNGLISIRMKNITITITL